MVNYRRIGISTVLGALLGVLCIIGVGGRIPGGYETNMIYLLGIWYNRLIMGVLIGFAGGWTIIKSENQKNLVNALIRGIIFGILISSATIFQTAAFIDYLGLLAGFAYGPIIDLVATYMEK